jgi:FKBP-type peptidyl-prolyl cis-trans isomerase SlyD
MMARGAVAPLKCLLPCDPVKKRHRGSPFCDRAGAFLATDRRERSMEATRGSVVSFNYTLTDDGGDVLDKSEQPLPYLHGYSNIIPGLERALEGTRPGDRQTVVVEPADAYGEHDPSRVMTLGRDRAEEGMDLQPGMVVLGETDDGTMPLTIREVTADTVVVDANHPLAGKRLHFDVEIVDVRAASEQELAQGHPED